MDTTGRGAEGLTGGAKFVDQPAKLEAGLADDAEIGQATDVLVAASYEVARYRSANQEHVDGADQGEQIVSVLERSSRVGKVMLF